jgi:glycyl-tRNA synthetase
MAVHNLPPQTSDLQSIMMSLQDFWAKKGCLIWQPYYTQVGAGTMNPATFLRVLGPEPWNVGYIEPSVRPDDGRYGENPNRFQLHYQFQVILKPDPGNPQELYLESLKSLGIDPRQHDIRFVEDNWEQPAISAWGLGWEVWLDGQEITQYTYFQQVGGQTLDPVAVEMTYGLDRILIALNNAAAIWTEPWGAGIPYGELRQREEFEHSKYYFEVADVARARQMYDLYASEVEACLALGLVVPAHDYVLKCSHTFNILDARGVIGVTERQAYFGRMRDMARRVAEAYLAQRLAQEYPLIKETERGLLEISATSRGQIQQTTPKAAVVTHAQPFLLEIGTEELPAGDIETALEQLRQRVPVFLDELRLEHNDIYIDGTPRRLVIFIQDLAPRQPDMEQVFKGPPADRAYDLLGQPTKAAEGFARGKGVSVQDLQVREVDGGRYVVAVVQQAGRPTVDVLSDTLPGLVGGIKFDRSMRWNSSNVPFSRPLRWLVALWGNQVVPFEFAGVCAGKITRGLRPYDSPEMMVRSAERYFETMGEAGVIIDTTGRRETIIAQVNALAESIGGVAQIEPGLLAEVANLVEKPTALLGSFNPDFLALPEEVLISVMRKHQRYFPVFSKGQDGHMLPYFIVVRNGDDQHLDIVRQGNEHVLGARFADANFFVREDLKHNLEDFIPRLAKLMFQTKLGSMLDKSRRISKLTEKLAEHLGLNETDMTTARRVAELCKADLTTKIVIDMTSLQGVLGRFYARRSGESQAVAEGIFEHYLPRFAGDRLPQATAGILVGLADRLDTLAGLFAVGMVPTGAKDPFAQRRAALGLVQVLVARDLDFDLRLGLENAASLLPLPATNESISTCLAFIIERLRNFLLEQGQRYDVIDAVLAAQGLNPAGTARSVKVLAEWVKRPDWHTILPAYARCVRITRPVKESYRIEPQVLIEPAECELWEALKVAENKPRTSGSVDDFLNAFLPMIPAIDKFFDEVLVMSEDVKLRQNRLALLLRIANLAADVADLSKLEGF